MIEKPTVLVLGAGASMDFEYPSGNGLVNEVLQITGNKNNDAYRTLKDLGHGPSEIQSFYSALYYSSRLSVDAFLEHQPEFVEIGKAAIALSLIKYEKLDTLFSNSDSWYKYLFDRMNTSFEDFGKNNLDVITFNYDRSLETYLFYAVQHAYGKSGEDVQEIVSRIEIVHVHGDLGKLPWQSPSGRPYKVTYDPETIQEVSKSIRVISAKHPVNGAFSEAKRLLSRSERIIFLGFGYHRTNLERLGIDTSLDLQLFGTSFGLTQLECEEIKEFFSPIPIQFGKNDWKVLQFLRERVSL